MRRDRKGSRGSPRPRWRTLPVLLFLIIIPCGCRLNTASEPAREVRVQLQGSVTTTVTLITSNAFQVQQTAQGVATLDFVIADTAQVNVPVDRTFPLAPTGRFALRVQAPLSDSAVVDLVVSTNGSERFRAEGQLLDVDQPLDFSFSRN